MHHRILPAILSLLLAGPAAAQNCFDGDFGALLGENTVDTVYPMQPIGFVFPFAGGTYTHVHVNDHGFVELSNNGVPAPLASGDPALYTPSVANFVAGAPKVAPLYCDMELTGGGQCFLQSTPAACTITWWNVRSYGVPSPRFSFQLRLEASGGIRCVFGPGATNNSTYGGVSASAICGVTPAGGAAAPPAVDLSAGGAVASGTLHERWIAANGFDLANNTLALTPAGGGFAFAPLGAPQNCATFQSIGFGCDGLGMEGVGLPSLGNPNYTLRATGLSIWPPLAFFGFGSGAFHPPLPLGPLLGMTGCEGYTNLDIEAFLGNPGGGGTCTLTFAVPVATNLIGYSLTAQAIALSLANPLGLVTSNGATLLVGWGY